MLYIMSKKPVKRRIPWEKLPKYRKQLFYDYIDDSKAMIRSFFLEGWTQSELDALAVETLTRAVKQYDPKKGTKFSTFLFNALKSEVVNFYQKKKKEPPIPYSIDVPLPGLSGEEIALVDVLEDLDAIKLDDYIRHTIINEELEDKLTNQEKKVIDLLEQGKRPIDIAKKLKLSPSRINIIMNQAREKAEEILYGE